jgi:hypothetical protein
MGVDVTAYSHLRLVEPPCPRPNGWCEDEEADHIQAFAYADHARSYEGLASPEDERTISGIAFIGFRCYARTDATQAVQVLSMAYGSYNRWRAMLCRAFMLAEPEDVWRDLDQYAANPFIDLVNFADNEGCIGPVSAARLRAGFTATGAREQFDEQVRRDLKDFPDLEGLALAKDGGLVSFG